MNRTMIHTTGYARLTPRQARVVLGVVCIVLVASVAVTLSPLASSNLTGHDDQPSDVELFRSHVDRMQRGEGYYEAAAAEMTARGYPTRSVFNWRTPLPLWLIGKMPNVMLGKALLGAMALALLLMAFEAMARDGNERTTSPHPRLLSGHRPKVGRERGSVGRPVACALLLTGPLMPTILGDLFYMPEMWAGIFIAMSVCAYGLNRPWLGVALGLTSVFFRELALPYCVLCAAMAWWQGRRKEWIVWAIGLLAWLGFFGIHWFCVTPLIEPNARAHQLGWIRFGGAGFVISTAQMNAYLLLLPQWVTAVYLMAALVGMAGWHSPLGTRVGLTICLFLIAFAVVGQRFNQYWGCLIAPLLCFGVVWFPASIRDLWQRCRMP